MSLLMATLFFFVLTAGLAALPFVPALSEWRRRRDAEPLKVVRRSEVDVRFFANRFRDFVARNLEGRMAECRESRTAQRGRLEDGTPYLVVGHDQTPVLTVEEQNGKNGAPLVLSCGDLRLPDAIWFHREIYADGSVWSGDNDVLRAVLAENEIHVGRGCTSLRWLHAARALYAQAGTVLWGRASAGVFVRVERGCRFERLHAPRIEFCFSAEAGEAAGGAVYRESAVLKRSEVGNRVEVAAGRWLVFGDLEVPPGRIVENDVVATGRLRLGPGVRVTGSVKSHGEMTLDKGVEISGSVVGEQNVYVGRECRINGPVLAEGAVFIRRGTRVGTGDAPTTIGAERLYIEPGVETHGTVWAHVEGVVGSPDTDGEEGES